MKKLITILFGGAILLISTQSIHSNPTGAPAGATGGPADNYASCTQTGCHFAVPSTVTNYYTTDIPATGYVPKRTYNITVSFTGTGKKGFSMSAQDSAGGYVGKFVTGTGSQIMGTNYITHTAAKSSTTASWTYQWTAPARGKGKFSFYGMFAITQSISKKQSLVYNENKSTPIVTTLPAAPVYTTSGNFNCNANAKSGIYKVSFQYRAQGGNWNFVNASSTDINGDTVVPFSIYITTLTPGTKYTYRACAWNAGDTTWGDSVTFTTPLNSGLSQLNNIQDVVVYPQPASNQLNIQLNLARTAMVQVKLYSLNGEEVSSLNYGKQLFGNNHLELPINLTKGIYILRILSDNETKTQKIIIE